MRRLILLFVIIILTSLQSFSQNILFNVGLNISSMSIDYSDFAYTTDRFPVISPDLSLGYEYYLTKSLSIKPAIAYSRQGRLIAMDLGSGFYYEEKFTINYIELPFLLSYNFNPRLTWGYSLNINAGPFIAYGFRGLVTSDNTAFVSEESLFLGGDGIERNDYGLMFRIGFGFPENQLSLTLSGGLKNLAITGGDYTRFRRIAMSLNYVRIIDFGPNARRMLRKRFF